MVALLLFISMAAIGQEKIQSRLELPLEQRLETPQRVAGASIRLTDFTSFIATAFKVPLLVETPAAIPDVIIPKGTYSARQLLDLAVRQLHGFAWKDEDGVAHLYHRKLVNSTGNILNVRIRRFAFPRNVAEFLYYFRPCISATVQGYGCEGGAFSGFQPADLRREPLPYLKPFKDELARTILLAALKDSGRFYVLIAFESTQPRLTSDYSYLNWFSQSLVPSEPGPIWVQRPGS